MSASVPYPPDSYPAEPHPPEVGSAVPVAAVQDKGLRLAWWLALGAAVVGVVIGVMMLIWPEATLKVVAALFGIWLVFYGVVRIVQAITGPAGEGAERAIVGVIGVLFVIAGVIALRNLLESLALLITVIGLMWLIGGILELISAFGPGSSFRGWRAAAGVLSILFALVVLFWPDLSLIALVYLTGIWLIVSGLFQIVLVFWARRSLTA
jgi:uncharacterized membrane protein HdeD (DUF308 family)